MFKMYMFPTKDTGALLFADAGALQNQHAVQLAAATARKFFELRGITPDIFDGIVFGSTIPKRCGFLMPLVCHADGQSEYQRAPSRPGLCTSTVSINVAASSIEVGNNANVLVATVTDHRIARNPLAEPFRPRRKTGL